MTLAAWPAPADAQDGPLLALGRGVAAEPGGLVAVPLTFGGGGADVSSMVFSVRHDAAWLTLDPADDDGDGVPDAVVLQVPDDFQTIVQHQPSKVSVTLFDAAPPFATVPDGTLAEITYRVGTPDGTTTAAVVFGDEPPPSFGSTAGGAIDGTTRDGSVRIAAATGDGPSPTPRPTVRATATPARAAPTAPRGGASATPGPVGGAPTATRRPTERPTLPAVVTASPHVEGTAVPTSARGGDVGAASPAATVGVIPGAGSTRAAADGGPAAAATARAVVPTLTAVPLASHTPRGLASDAPGGQGPQAGDDGPDGRLAALALAAIAAAGLLFWARSRSW